MPILTTSGTENPFTQGDVGLALAPHEDDTKLCAALAQIAAVRNGTRVILGVATNGDNGYNKDKDKSTIVAVRQEETRAACKILGISSDDIHFLGYPENLDDGHTIKHPARPGDPDVIHGMSGLDNSLTRLLRVVRPDWVIIPHGVDYHPVHKRVYEAFLISLFHASGKIWTDELGDPLERIPTLIEGAVYCDFDHNSQPNIQVVGEGDDFEKKLAAIACFESQPQIASLVERVKEGGPQEFFHQRSFTFFDPNKYKKLPWETQKK